LPNTDIDGPVLANAAMLNNTTVARQATLLGQQGSTVRLGNMLLLPLRTAEGEDRLLYVRPLYVDVSDGLPLARLVIVADDTRVRICPTLELALGALAVPEGQLNENCEGVSSPFTGKPVDIGEPPDSIDTPDPDAPGPDATPTPVPTPTPTPGDSTPPPPEALALLREAQAKFDAADQALADGDLGEYQTLVDEGRALIEQALALIGAVDGVTPTPTPTPTPATTPEPAATPSPGA
jgi:uncharacterized membrane protein (UPF0182 family)